MIGKERAVEILAKIKATQARGIRDAREEAQSIVEGALGKSLEWTRLAMNEQIRSALEKKPDEMSLDHLPYAKQGRADRERAIDEIVRLLQEAEEHGE